MNKELQDKAWASLPAAFKREAGKDYIKVRDAKKLDPDNERVLAHIQCMEHYFGIDNLPANEVTKYVTEYSGENFVTSKDLNLCSLLQGCEGMEFYSKVGVVKQVGFDGSTTHVRDGYNRDWWVQPDGTLYKGSGLFLFPSAEVRTWEGWQAPKKRWKPKKNEEYWFVTDENEADCSTWVNDTADAMRYKVNVVFRLQSQAEEAAKRIREALKKYHDEIGE